MVYQLLRMGGSSSSETAAGLFSALLYGTASVSMIFVNKYTLRVFPLTNVVVALQMVVTWAILHGLLEAGLLHFPRFNLRKAWQLFGITLLYTGNTVFALVGLKTLNIPMYNVLKRMTPVLVLVVKAVVRKKWPQTSITASVLVIVGGCVIAGIGDLTFDAAGYMFALLSCTIQAGYLLLVEFQNADHGVSTSEMLYYNAVTSLPLLAGVVLLTGEWDMLPAAYTQGVEGYGALWLCATVLTCSLMGVLLNYAMFLCTTTNSALTTTIVGIVKGVVAVLLGFVLLGGVPFSLVNVIGIALNTAGATWYSVIKYQQQQQARGAKPATGSSHDHYDQERGGSSGKSSS